MTKFDLEKERVMDKEELQREMDWYGVGSVEEVVAIWEAQSAAQEQFEVDRITNEIQKGESPNKKDIAYLLKNNKRAEIDQVMRDYIAKLLLGEKLERSQRNSRLSDNGQELFEFNPTKGKNDRTRVESMFGCIYEFKFLNSLGVSKEICFDKIAKAKLLKDYFNGAELRASESKKGVDEYVESIDKAWNELPEEKIIELEEDLEKEVQKIDKLVYPRKRPSKKPAA